MTFFLLVLGPSYVIPVNYLVFCFCLIPLMFIFQPLAKVNSKYKSIRTFSFLKTFSWLPITFRTQSNLTVPARPHTIKHRPTSDLLSSTIALCCSHSGPPATPAYQAQAPSHSPGIGFPPPGPICPRPFQHSGLSLKATSSI